MASRWRAESDRIVRATLEALPPTATDKEKRSALREAYPFGERAMLPYKHWLAAIRAALGPSRPPKAKPEIPLPTPMPTRDAVADALLAALREDPADMACIGALADRCEERGHDYWARSVREALAGYPPLHKVAQRLWPGCQIIRAEIHGYEIGEIRNKHGKRLCKIDELQDQIEGRYLVVDPAVTEAVAIERAAAVLSLFSAEAVHA